MGTPAASTFSAVMGISQEEEIVLTNGTARERFAPLQSLLPGTAIEDVLPDEAVQAIRDAGGTAEPLTCDVTNADRVAEVVDRLSDRYGRGTVTRAALLEEKKDNA